MTADERRESIRRLLNERGNVRVAELAESYGVTMQTIRRDLSELAESDGIVKAHGKAIRATSHHFESADFVKRLELDADLKRAIGRRAAQLVADQDIIAFDSTTTAYATAREIANRENLVVFLNNVQGLVDLMGKVNARQLDARLIFLGGEIHRDEMSCFGELTETPLDRFYFDKVFIGAGGASIADGLTAYSVHTGRFAAELSRRADETILVVDGTKIANRTLYRFGDLHQVNTIVTTVDPPDDEWREFVSEHRIEWINALEG